MTESSSAHTETSQTDLLQPTINIEISRKCKDLVEDYRTGDTSKLQTFLAIQALLTSDASRK